MTCFPAPCRAADIVNRGTSNIMHEDSALILPATLLKQCQKVRMCKKLLQLMENIVTRQSVQKQIQDLESNIASNSILKKNKNKIPTN